MFQTASCFTFCNVEGILGAMNKLITIGVIAGLLFMYGKYVTDMQHQAMQNIDAIKHQYTHAEEIASQLH